MDMTVIPYSQTSLYAATPQVTNYGIQYLDFWNPQALLINPNDVYINLDAKYNLRPDLLSYDYYQTVDYWWVFMRRNPNIIKDPIWDFVTGIKIFVPTKETLPRSILSNG
jgi:hypothetical protein